MLEVCFSCVLGMPNAHPGRSNVAQTLSEPKCARREHGTSRHTSLGNPPDMSISIGFIMFCLKASESHNGGRAKPTCEASQNVPAENIKRAKMCPQRTCGHAFFIGFTMVFDIPSNLVRSGPNLVRTCPIQADPGHVRAMSDFHWFYNGFPMPCQGHAKSGINGTQRESTGTNGNQREPTGTKSGQMVMPIHRPSQVCSTTSFTHSFIHSFIHSFTHSFTHSLIHSLIH